MSASLSSSFSASLITALGTHFGKRRRHDSVSTRFRVLLIVSVEPMLPDPICKPDQSWPHAPVSVGDFLVDEAAPKNAW